MTQLLTAQEVAQILKVSARKVTQMANRKELPGTRKFGDWRFDQKDFEKTLKATFDEAREQMEKST